MSIHSWNQALWQDLTRDRAKLPHAMLLHGPRGIGKRDLALNLAQWLLCEEPGSDGPCGHCKACGWFEQGAHPDFRLVESESDTTADDESGKKSGKQISIKEIRALGDFLGLASHQGGWRVVVIHPAELMNIAASNALLKTLEEPPSNVLLILISHMPRRLLPTILSRCRKLALSLPSLEQAREWLSAEGLDEAAEALHEVGGAPLLAAECAEPERMERRRRFLEALATPEAQTLSKLAQDSQQRLEESWGWLTRWVYDLIAVAASGEARYFPDQGVVLKKLVGRIRPVAIWQLQQELFQAGRWLRHPLNAQLLLESWLLRYLDTLETRYGR